MDNTFFIYSNRIYTPMGVTKGYLKIENGTIKDIYESVEGGQIINYEDKIIIPGFIDIHIHGWSTGSFWMRGDYESLANMSKELVRVGVTSYLPTTGADDLNKTKKQLGEGKRFIKDWTPETGSEPIGFHLEGPFLSKEYRGMQKEEYCIHPSLEVYKELLEASGEENVRLMTIAPELPGAKEVIAYSKEKGIQISAGHTSADFEDIKELKDYGIGGFTHVYSGMRGFHHRRPGVVGAAMYFKDMYVEFAKQTGLTVKPEAFEIMYRLKGKEKVILSTDCSGIAFSNEPFYNYIRKCTYTPVGDGIKLKYDDGREQFISHKDVETIRELELSFLGSVKNVVKNIDASIEDIVAMASENPAKYVGVIDRKGTLEPGKDADMLVIDEDFNICDVFVKGVKQDLD